MQTASLIRTNTDLPDIPRIIQASAAVAVWALFGWTILLLLLTAMAVAVGIIDAVFFSLRHIEFIVAGSILILLPLLAEWVAWLIALLFASWRRLQVDAKGIRYRLGSRRVTFAWPDISRIETERDRTTSLRFVVVTHQPQRPNLTWVLRLPTRGVLWMLALTGDLLATVLAGSYTGASFFDEMRLEDDRFIPKAFPVACVENLARPA